MHFILSKLRDTLLLRVKSGCTDIHSFLKVFLSFQRIFEVQGPFEVFLEQVRKNMEKMNESSLHLKSNMQQIVNGIATFQKMKVFTTPLPYYLCRAPEKLSARMNFASSFPSSWGRLSL